MDSATPKTENPDDRRTRLAPLDEELLALNSAVKDALASRKAWMDAHMPDYAKYQVGEAIYDLRTSRLLGEVIGHYRYWGGNAEFDTSMSIEYRYKEPAPLRYNFIDNTSRHAGTLSLGNAEELALHHESQARIARGRRRDGGIDWAALFNKSNADG